ncbi:putative amidohydrolase [Roseivirga ehrenbergii]|uniref:Carbon-nitrogen hydrolase n=1 Tax=Roseivirga ehrenbergii (strain DSM 102268 / JCM 13514 / KCTC 12282 / NCIMB 14502 / KMM 6017) TaxID=279360 RepID=A0A150XN64_ROSEK|nr:carbon-nitrogen hydrolase family protein [Roseivirga ehrenbergii]KYG80188.1 carbon-nitrogen hydrolase [Roseivirga ehrenbergii]TCK99219.1 putative amidohydrolase [Roseivirga ehrenbergii]
MREIQKIELRQLEISDFKNLTESMKAAYENWSGGWWDEHHIQKLIDIFPEGQLVIVADDEIAGCALSLIVDYDKFGDNHTYAKITGNYTFSTHDPNGDVIYGIEVFIKPDFRGLRLGRRLYDARKELCENLNLEAVVFGGRIPNYHKYSNELTPRQYIDKVKLKELYDPTLTFQLSNDFHVNKVIKGYMPGDDESEDYAVLLEWNNIYYVEQEPQLSDQKTVVRLGLIQWQMRPYNGIDELFEQIEFFVDAVSGYKSDFALFPEFFNAPLMAKYNHLSEAEAIRKLAEFTDEIRERFSKLAISYNVNIITGSMPKMDGPKLYNVGFLCRRDGTFEEYTKMHVTPDEAKYWGLTGGDTIKVYETDCGPIGVLICYDVEFPELPRILANDGMNILFVPFLTDTQNGYSRVRYCARARAIENECYVAIAGSVGNLPKVENMDIQFAQSVVFTPCDFAFPTTGIKAEATPNTEMILVADVDLDLLWTLHNKGAVRNLKDRRTDVYDIRLKKK